MIKRHAHIALLVLALASTASARSEFHLGGSGTNSWERFLVADEAAGSYVVVDAAGKVHQEIRVGAIEENGGDTYLAEYNYRGPDLPAMAGNVLQARRIDPKVNLARDDSLFARGGNIYQAHNIGHDPTAELLALIDGDPTTKRLVLVAESVFASGLLLVNASPVVLNLGTELPINRIRIFPRLGQMEDAAIISGFDHPKPPKPFGESGFSENYLEWFEIAVADNDAPLLESPGGGRGARPDQTSFKRFAEDTGFVGEATDPNLEALIQTRENLDVVVDFRFPVRSERFVSVRPMDPERTFEMAEIEVYGEGYVRRSVYRSQILDFGKPVAWSKIRWQAEQPRDTRILLRTRTGHTPQPDLFMRRSVNQQFQPVEFVKYQQNFPSDEVKRMLDAENWSFWSATYDFAAGRRDEAAAATWEDGTVLLSPGPRRYLQFEIVLEATAESTPRLEELSLLFAESPAAEEVIAEIWPIQVDSFERQSFTYVVKPILRDGNRGFDRLEIFTGGRADTVRAVRVGGDEILDRFPAAVEADRIVISFDRLEDPREDNEKRIEVEFDARVLRFGAEFSAWVYDSREPDLKQSVVPGNATFRYAGDGLSVRTPTGGDLLRRFAINPRSITPNGDEVNDEAVISFDLRDLIEPRRVDVVIRSLDGRRIRGFSPALETSGHISYRWNGHDDAGKLAPPGVYIVQIELESDEGRETAAAILAIAY